MRPAPLPSPGRILSSKGNGSSRDVVRLDGKLAEAHAGDATDRSERDERIISERERRLSERSVPPTSRRVSCASAAAPAAADSAEPELDLLTI